MSSVGSLWLHNSFLSKCAINPQMCLPEKKERPHFIVYLEEGEPFLTYNFIWYIVQPMMLQFRCLLTKFFSIQSSYSFCVPNRSDKKTPLCLIKLEKNLSGHFAKNNTIISCTSCHVTNVGTVHISRIT